jgi:hypothetical protein
LIAVAGVAAIAADLTAFMIGCAADRTDSSERPQCGWLTEGQARAQLSEHFEVMVPDKFRMMQMRDICTGDDGWMADPWHEYVGQFTAPPQQLDDHPVLILVNFTRRTVTCADPLPWQPTGLDCTARTTMTLYTEVAVTPDSCSVLVTRSVTAANVYTDCKWGYVG